MKKKILIAVGVSLTLVIGATGAVVAEEGSFTRAADAFSRAVAQVFQTASDDSNTEVSVDEDIELETEDVEPQPITYPNGFTEGELDDNGTPRFSSREFVPEGLKESEVDFCATAEDYQKCQDDLFEEFWDAQAPEGSGWREIRFGDAPQIWVNESENVTKWHQLTELYLKENMHLHVTDINEPYISGNYLVWDPSFELDNQDFFYHLNSKLESSKVKIVYKTSAGSESYDQGLLAKDLGVTAKNIATLRLGLEALPQCTEGNVYLQIVTPPSAKSILMTSEPTYFSNISQGDCQDAQQTFSINGGTFSLSSSLMGNQLFDVEISASVEMLVSDFADITESKLLVATPEGEGLEFPASVSQTAPNRYQIVASASKQLLLQQGNHTVFLSVVGSSGAGDLVKIANFINEGTENKVDISLP